MLVFFRAVSLSALLFLLMGSPLVRAADLTLFGHRLDTISRQDLDAAARQAGAQPSGHNGEVYNFDASKIGLPGVERLQIVSFHDHVVMAQYFFPANDSQRLQKDEALRKMLVAKYGYPTSNDDSWRVGTGKFDAEYVADTKYRWTFANGMELVYSHEFFGDRYLTYLNKSQQALMQRALDTQSKKGANQAARTHSDVF